MKNDFKVYITNIMGFTFHEYINPQNVENMTFAGV